MEAIIKIIPTDTCKIIIKDLSTYLSEDFTGETQNKFKYSETMSVDIIQHNKINDKVIKNILYNIHTDQIDTSLSINFDGWFTITHLILPSKEWFNKELNKPEGSSLNLYKEVYYTDGKSVYQYINQESKEVPIESLLAIDHTGTTIFKTTQDYISICFLRKCYINLCQEIFNNRGFSQCRDRNYVDPDLIYRRDLLLMSLNVIGYLTEKEQLNEVERLIELLRGCNGLCTESVIMLRDNDCGCA